MRYLFYLTLLLGIVGKVLGILPNFTFDCATSSVTISFVETYLDNLVSFPVRSVYFYQEGADLAAIRQNPPTDNCGTTDTGDNLVATFSNFQDCAFSTEQAGGTITFTYKGILLTLNNGIVVRESEHFFTFQCIYADEYNVDADSFQPYLANFFSSDSASATLTPTLTLFNDAGFSVALPTDRGVSTTGTIYVQIESHNIFLIEVSTCVTSPLQTLGDREQTVLIVNDVAAAMSQTTVDMQDSNVFQFHFMPQFTHVQDLYVVCEVQICDTIASGATCLAGRRKRSTAELVGDGPVKKTYLLSEPIHFEHPASDAQLDGSNNVILTSSAVVTSNAQLPVTNPVAVEAATSSQAAIQLETSSSSSAAPKTTVETTTTQETPSVAVTTSKPVTITPKPPTSSTASTTSTPKPPTNTPKPATSSTASTTITPKPATNTPKQVTNTPKVVSSSTNQPPHLDQEHQKTNPKKDAPKVYRPHDNGDVKHPSGEITSRFIDYISQTRVVFYLAVGLLVLMLVVMMVVTYKRCVGKNKVARVDDQDWEKN